jgi:Tol biopolymer transport system component
VYTRAFQYSNLWLFARAPAGPVVSGRPLTRGTSTNQFPAISPDDSQIAFVSSAERGLVTMPIEGGRPRRLTFLDAPFVGTPAWSPDGRRIAFGAVERGVPRVWLSDLGSGTSLAFLRSVLSSSGSISWSPGTKILYQAIGNRNYRVLDPDTKEERLLIQNDSVGWIFEPQYSLDRRSVAVFWNRGAEPGLWRINLADDSQSLLQKGRYIPIGWAADGQAVYALELEGWDPAAWGRKVYRIRMAGGEPKIAALFPFVVSHVRMTRDSRRFVATAEETKSDAWRIDNFDPRSN